MARLSAECCWAGREHAGAGRGVRRPRYYANDHSRDELEIAPVVMEIIDAAKESARQAAPVTVDEIHTTLAPA